MSYTWGIKDLYNCQKKLVQIAKDATDKQDELYILAVLEDLEDTIRDMEDKDAEPTVSYRERMEIIEGDLVTYAPYYSLIERFADTLDLFDEQLDRIDKIVSPVFGPSDSYGKITGAKLPNDYAFSLVKSFYHGFDNVLYPTFLQAYEQRKSSVRFLPNVDKYHNAISFYIDIIKRYFITCVKSNDVSKLYVLIHEYGHVLSYILNPKRYLYCFGDMYDEVPAIFPELVAYRKNPGNFHPLHPTLEEYGTLITNFNVANNLLMHDAFVEIWKRNKGNVDDKFFRMVKREYDLDVDEIDEGSETYIYDDGKYIISYMTAIELLNLYRRDKDKALRIYRDILRVPHTESVHDYVSSELKLGSHLEEETSMMLNDFEHRLKKEMVFHV